MDSHGFPLVKMGSQGDIFLRTRL